MLMAMNSPFNAAVLLNVPWTVMVRVAAWALSTKTKAMAREQFRMSTGTRIMGGSSNLSLLRVIFVGRQQAQLNERLRHTPVTHAEIYSGHLIGLFALGCVPILSIPG
jgi:hypothetical protein